MSSNILIEYNRAKIKLINKYIKYSKNLSRAKSDPNTFISINDFLADEPSLGPDADKGEIDYFYMHYENINNFMKILMNDLSFNKIVCISDITVKHTKFINRNSFVYNFDFDYLVIPIDAINEILECKDKRFIYINLIISWENKNIGHANMLLIDNINKTIERFEPFQSLNLSLKIDKKFNNDVLKKINLNDYKYISPIDISPKIGIQNKADAYNGMCVTYCIIYLQLRLMNPDIEKKIIIKYLLSKKKNEIINIILRYARYIENSLKKNSFMVNLELNKLYYEEYKLIKSYLIVYDNEIKTDSF